MALDVDALKNQLTRTETDLELAKAHVYRCDGVVQMLKHFITLTETEKPESDKSEPPFNRETPAR